MSGILYTSYFANIKKGKGLKISISLTNPKWFDIKDIDYWFRDLAPTKELLYDYKYKGISWKEYTDRYLLHLKSMKCRMAIKELEYLLKQGNITIYCHEKFDNCHRHILAQLFKELGYKVKEI